MHAGYFNLHWFGRICMNPWTLLIVTSLGSSLVGYALGQSDLKRDVSKGQVVHQPFHVAIILDKNSKRSCVDCTMNMIPYLLKKHVNSTFLMPKTHGKGECGEEYTVLNSSAGEQTISFKTEWTLSRYRATEKSVEPLYSEELPYDRFTIQGLICGVCLGVLTYALGYYLTHKYSAG